MRGHFLSQLLVVVALTLAASLGKAESIVIIPMYADRGVPRQTSERVMRAMILHLERVGHEVVLPAAASQRTLTSLPAPESCNAPECYAKYTDETRSTLGLVLTLFQDKQGTSASIVLFQPPAHEYYEGVELQPDFEPQVAAILDRLLASHRQGPGPWLEVSGEPAQAMLLVDGEVAGLLPYRGRVSKGEHIVTVRANGYRESSVTIRVDSFANTVARQKVALESTAQYSSQPLAVTKDPAHRNWWRWSAILSAGAGAGVLTFQARALARSGECSNPSCTKTWGSGPRSNSVLTGGVVLLALGTSIGAGLLWKRMRESASVHADRSGVVLNLRADF